MFAKSIDNFKNCMYNKGEHFFKHKKFHFSQFEDIIARTKT